MKRSVAWGRAIGKALGVHQALEALDAVLGTAKRKKPTRPKRGR
jgi:hypothetical protein